MIPLRPITLPPLPYSYDVFEPHISEDAMHIHHNGHHKGYVTKFNKLLRQFNSGKNISMLDLEFNFFGHLLHSYYWNSISPLSTTPGPLTEKLIALSYGSFDSFLDQLISAAVSIKGSGWVAVVMEDGYISIKSFDNHELFQIQGQPLLVIDVWEHAYYLDYQNRKRTFFAKLVSFINWDTFEKRLRS